MITLSFHWKRDLWWCQYTFLCIERKDIKEYRKIRLANNTPFKIKYTRTILENKLSTIHICIMPKMHGCWNFTVLPRSIHLPDSSVNTKKSGSLLSVLGSTVFLCSILGQNHGVHKVCLLLSKITQNVTQRAILLRPMVSELAQHFITYFFYLLCTQIFIYIFVLKAFIHLTDDNICICRLQKFFVCLV